MEEIWKDVIGYEGYYQVSNLGRVKSLERKVRNCCTLITLKGKLMNPSPNNQKYLCVSLSKEGKLISHKVHRLVAEHFIPNPENKREVNHMDGDKNNNSRLNIEWVTPKENTQHAHRNGLVKHKKGAEHYRAKIIHMIDEKGNVVKAYGTMNEAEKEGYNLNLIRQSCVTGEDYKGYKWKYVA